MTIPQAISYELDIELDQDGRALKADVWFTNELGQRSDSTIPDAELTLQDGHWKVLFGKQATVVYIAAQLDVITDTEGFLDQAAIQRKLARIVIVRNGEEYLALHEVVHNPIATVPSSIFSISQRPGESLEEFKARVRGLTEKHGIIDIRGLEKGEES